MWNNQEDSQPIIQSINRFFCLLRSETNGQSNLTYGRIAAAHERFRRLNRIRQVATMCTHI